MAHPQIQEVMEKQEFNVGTRRSKLALVQTDIIVDALKKAWPSKHFNVQAHATAAGDIDKVTPFKDMPVKNLWTHELEKLLMEGQLDVLVHSLKGMASATLTLSHADTCRCPYTTTRRVHIRRDPRTGRPS